MVSLVISNLRHFLRVILVLSIVIISLQTVNAKPTNNPQKDVSPTSALKNSFRASQPVITGRSLDSSRSGRDSPGRKVLTSLHEDGTWQASARLPTTTRSGGKGHSRYKIRRDGSLSLSLQSPKSANLYQIGRTSKEEKAGNIASLLGKSVNGRSNNNNNNGKQFSPSELRSFSVVISDVDVTGNYNKNIYGNHHDIGSLEDSYSKAGVSSYHLKSNSIHRMNASWKLKAGHLTPSSDDLLEFLSYFANSDGRATRSEPDQGQSQQEQKSPALLYKRKILGQRGDGHDKHFSQEHDQEEKTNNQPFLTWSESSRNIPLSSSTELIETVRSSAMTNETLLLDEVNDATIKGSEVLTGTSSSNVSESISIADSKEAKVLHDLLSTLEELNESVDTVQKKSKTVSSSSSTSTSSSLSKSTASEGIKNVSGNHAQNNNNTHDKEEDSSLQLQSSQQTELDQARKNGEEQVQLVDEEMTESSPKIEEKEGELFVGNDTATFFDSNGNSNDSNTTHNLHLTGTSFPTLEDEKKEMIKAKKRRNAKSAFFESTTKSANRNDHEDDEKDEEYENNNMNRSSNNTNLNETSSGRSTSATSIPMDMRANNGDSSKRMKITDPQQTASDLKKLMSLILKSDGTKNIGGFSQLANTGSIMGEEERKSGAQVVNIVITPNQETFLTPSPSSHLQITAHNPQMKIQAPQKILFLKTPQVKQMLDMALTDPAVSSAAQKIAAALEADPFPNPVPTNANYNYEGNRPEYYSMHPHNIEEDGSSSTPNGFPLSGNGFLNMNHPNLQFHQALHHMIVNGSAPTTINATTKTNIINIFVINFKESNNLGSNSAEETGVLQHQLSANQSPFRINIKPSQKPKLPLPISVKPLLIESVSTTPSPPDLSSFFFNNKMGLAAQEEDDEAEASDPTKNFDMAHNHHHNHHHHHHHDHHAMSNSPDKDKINIFDLLPGDIGSVTSVQYAPGVENDNQNQTMIPEHNKLSSLTMPTDYFADFLPDRSRDPPGIENPNRPLNEHDDILAILASHRPKRPAPIIDESVSLSSAAEDQESLPPALAHLQWIFKNQPPPKPQISHHQHDFFLKRKGQVETDTKNDDVSTSNGSNASGSDSMMEPEETSNSPLKYQGSSTQELVDFLMKLQNVTRPLSSFDMNEIKNRYKNGTKRPEINYSQQTMKNNSTNQIGVNGTASNGIHYTTKRPPFWKFGNKLPVGSLNTPTTTNNNNNDEAMNNRLRKLLTAFGYSALPTIAAGAAATWPFWVPLVATGRRRRRSVSPSSISITQSHNYDDENGENRSIQEFIERRGQAFLTNAMIKTNNSNYYALADDKNSTQRQPSSSNRQLLSKSTKNSRLEGNSNLGGEKKWIKVDVITSSTPFSSSSSPTLHDFDEKNNSHSLSQVGLNNTKNNRDDNDDSNKNKEKTDEDGRINENLSPQQKHRHDDEKQQLDVPLIKDFLKNVLYSEFNVPTKAPSSLSTINPVKNNDHVFNRPTTTTKAPAVLSQYPIFTSNKNNNNNLHKLITKHGQQSNSPPIHSGGVNKNSYYQPFSRPSPTPFYLEQMIAGGGSSSKKVIPISPLTTPSPTSVYIHNRGDGMPSAITSTQSSPTSFSTASSLVHWVNENKNKPNPWGSSFSKDELDKVGASISSAFANTAEALSGHQWMKNNNAHYEPLKTVDYHQNNFHHQTTTNKVLQSEKVADSIRAAERSYTSAALFPLWFPILFGNQSQMSAKLKEAVMKNNNGGKYS